MGVAYKKDISALRESPALEIIKKLEEEKVILSYYDPYIPDFMYHGKEYKTLEKMTEDEIRDKDVVVITTAHDNMNYDFFVKHARAVFDINNVIKIKNKNVEKL